MKEYLERALSLKGFFVFFIALFIFNTVRVNLPLNYSSPRVLIEKIVIRHLPKGSFIARWSYSQSSEKMNFIEQSGIAELRLDNEQVAFSALDGEMVDNWAMFISNSIEYSFSQGLIEIDVSSEFHIGNLSQQEALPGKINVALRQNKEGELTSVQVNMGEYSLELNDIQKEEDYLNTHHIAYFKEFYSFVLYLAMSIGSVSIVPIILDNQKITSVSF